MKIKESYFTKICYNVNEYVDFITNLTHEEITQKLISVIEKDDKLILSFKEVYTEL